MKKGKRVLALIGAILLVALYLSTLVFALMGKEFLNLLMASIAATVVIPVLIWTYSFVYRLLKGKGGSDGDDGATETMESVRDDGSNGR